MCGVEHDLKAELATARERIEIRDQDLRNRDAHIVELKREFVEAHKQMENMGRGHVEETNRLAQERDNARERITELETSRSDHLNDPDQIASLEAELADNAMLEALRRARQQRDIARFNEDALRDRLATSEKELFEWRELAETVERHNGCLHSQLTGRDRADAQRPKVTAKEIELLRGMIDDVGEWDPEELVALESTIAFIESFGANFAGGADAKIGSAGPPATQPDRESLGRIAFEAMGSAARWGSLPITNREKYCDMAVAVERASGDRISMWRIWMSERETCRTKLENLQAELAEASRQNETHEATIAELKRILANSVREFDQVKQELAQVRELAQENHMAGGELIGKLYDKLAAARRAKCSECPKQFERGVEEGRATQAILEIRGREKILAEIHQQNVEIAQLKREFVEAHKQMENMGRGHVEETNRLAQERDNARERITELETSRSDHLNDPDQIASLEAELADNAMSDLRAEYDRLKTQLAAALRCDVTADQLQTLREFGYGTYVEDHASLAAAIADIERRVG